MIKWWVMLSIGGLFPVVWGFCLMIDYGIESPAAIIGIALIMLGGWNSSRLFNLRRYIWYGDLD